MADEPQDDHKTLTHGAPGSDWRLVARVGEEKLEWGNQGTFDELRVDGWLHLEQMDTRDWSMMAGDARLTIHIGEDGVITVDVERGFYGDVVGTTGEFTLES